LPSFDHIQCSFLRYGIIRVEKFCGRISEKICFYLPDVLDADVLSLHTPYCIQIFLIIKLMIFYIHIVSQSNIPMLMEPRQKDGQRSLQEIYNGRLHNWTKEKILTKTTL